VTDEDASERRLAAERTWLAQRVEERTVELKAANSALGQALLLKDQFLAAISHELRTPLNAILTVSEVLQEGTYGPLEERQNAALRNVDDSGQHLLGLINEILDLSRMDAGKLELDLTWGSAEGVCEAALRMVAEPATLRKLAVSFTSDGQVDIVRMDERRLKQMLVNLLGNAVKFTPDGGAFGLHLAGDRAAGQMRITVWDTGIGIAPEDLDRMFEPFVQLDARLARRYEGTGLGLALVRRLAELHGGTVEVASTLGYGSRFTLVLPWIPQSA
jgi:signal transduction histidine kinase